MPDFKGFRAKRGWSQAELARRLGVKSTVINRAEVGRASGASYGPRMALLEILEKIDVLAEEDPALARKIKKIAEEGLK